MSEPRERNTAPRRGWSLHTKIFLGLLVGVVAGVAANAFFSHTRGLLLVEKYVSDPLGTIFLNLLIMIVIPLVFASLALGVAQIGDLRHLGRIGVRTAAYFLLVTALAVVIGLTLVNTIRPGDYLPKEMKGELMSSYGERATELKGTAQKTEIGMDLLVAVVPRNPFAAIATPTPNMLALIFISLITGVGLTQIRAERAAPILRLLEGINDLTAAIIHLVMRLAPYGVAALLFSVTSRFGFRLLGALGMFVVTVLLGLAIHLFVSFPILVRTFARYSPMRFFRKVQTVMLTAFSTSSSSATLPTTITVSEEELGIPESVSGFVLPLGATMNMNGTALFEGVTVLFLAQVFGVHLSLPVQIFLILMSVLTAVGAAGVPSGAIPLMIIVLGLVHVPAEGIALILGVDRILDMCRTVVNVTGDITCAAYVARTEGITLKE